jgi:nucleoside-diphosphate-sugar epimerase
MMTLVVGASGATGKMVVEQLLKAGQKVKIIVRASAKIPQNWHNAPQIIIIRKDLTAITVVEMAEIIADCRAVVSCLGHNMTWKGIYGKPRRLVADAVALLCRAIINNAGERPVKLILMNTAGNSNRDHNEVVSTGQIMITGLLRILLPPLPDNEKAAEYLRVQVGQHHPFIEWVAVRPDSLVNMENVSAYSAHPSPTRSPLFNPGKTSRINVGHFMASLISDEILWEKWKGQMPVIYNEEEYTI